MRPTQGYSAFKPSRTITTAGLLHGGPVSNRALSAVALKYTSRISDLRAAGYDIQARVDRVTGLTMYHLQ